MYCSDVPCLTFQDIFTFINTIRSMTVLDGLYNCTKIPKRLVRKNFLIMEGL